MNDYNVIKQIGKGSFSNVHLCKKNKSSSLLLLSGICNDENYDDELFIIKNAFIHISTDNIIIDWSEWKITYFKDIYNEIIIQNIMEL